MLAGSKRARGLIDTQQIRAASWATISCQLNYLVGFVGIELVPCDNFFSDLPRLFASLSDGPVRLWTDAWCLFIATD